MALFALGSLGGPCSVRHGAFLGAVVVRDLYVLFALASLGGTRFLRRRSLLGALAFDALYVIFGFWEPWR